jgi:hypothetical protein
MGEVLERIAIVLHAGHAEEQPARQPVVEDAVDTVAVGGFQIIGFAQIPDVIERRATRRRAALEVQIDDFLPPPTVKPS